MAGSVEETADWLRLASQALGAARALLDAGYYRDAVSKAYYAMFYSAKAAVLSEGVRVTKHSAVTSAFGMRFARAGRVPPHLHKVLLDAFEDRGAADYGPRWEAQRDVAERRLAQAEEFVSEISRLLSQLE